MVYQPTGDFEDKQIPPNIRWLAPVPHTRFNFLKLIKKYNKQKVRRVLMQSLHPESIMTSVKDLIDTVDEYNTLILPKVRSEQYLMTEELTSLALL